MGAHAGPSVVRALPGAWDVVSGPSEVRTLPGTSDLGSVPPKTATGAPCSQVERRLELLLQKNSPNCPQVSLFFFSLFLFEKIFLLNPAFTYKGGPVLSHSPPLQLDWGLSGSGPDTSQLSTLPSQCTRSPWVYHFVLIPLPATSSNQISGCCSNLVWQGRGPSTRLSPRSPAAGLAGSGPGAAAALVPALVPGTLLS